MRSVEDVLARHLRELCEARIAQARSELRDQRAMLAALASDPAAETSAAFGPHLERSVLGMVQEQLPGRGQADGRRTPGPVYEPLADGALERRDLLTDRGLRVPEPAGGAVERALVGDRLEGSQMPELDTEPPFGPDEPSRGRTRLGVRRHPVSSYNEQRPRKVRAVLRSEGC